MSDTVYLAYDYPVLGAFLTALWVFLWVLWLFLVFRIVVDIFRDDAMGGWVKAGWLLFVLVLPFLGVFVYVCVRGAGMGRRESQHAKGQRHDIDEYIRKTAGSGGGTSADELAKLAEMKREGHLSEEEFQRAKDKILN